MVAAGTAQLGLPDSTPVKANHRRKGSSLVGSAVEGGSPRASPRPGDGAAADGSASADGSGGGSAADRAGSAADGSAAGSGVGSAAGSRLGSGVGSASAVPDWEEEEYLDTEEMQHAQRALGVKHKKYLRACALKPARRADAEDRVAQIWEDFAHVMTEPLSEKAEEETLARLAQRHVELGNGPLRWNSVAAQNHAGQMRGQWWAEQDASPPRGPGGGPGRTGNSQMRGKAFQREIFDVSHHSWRHDDSRKVKGRHKKRDKADLSGAGTLTGDALQAYLGFLGEMTDEYARTNDEMVHKAAAVRSMKEIRAAGTTHEREAIHTHGSMEAALANSLTRTASIGAGATEPKLANLRAMRSAEVVAPKHKVEPLPELPLPQPGTKYYVSSGLNNLNLTDMNATAAMSAVGRPEGSPERKPMAFVPGPPGSPGKWQPEEKLEQKFVEAGMELQQAREMHGPLAVEPLHQQPDEAAAVGGPGLDTTAAGRRAMTPQADRRDWLHLHASSSNLHRVSKPRYELPEKAAAGGEPVQT